MFNKKYTNRMIGIEQVVYVAALATAAFFAAESLFASENVSNGGCLIAPAQNLKYYNKMPQGIPAPAVPVQHKSVQINMLKAEERNGDYLNHVQVPSSEKSLNAVLFDKEITDEMSSKYYSFATNYEFKKQYQLNTKFDEENYNQSNKDLVDWTMMRMVQFHAENSTKKTDQNSAAGKTVVTTVKAVQAIQNTAVNLGENTKARFRYNLPNGTATLGLNSSIVNTSVDYRTKPLTATVGDPGMEKLTVSMDKQINPIKVKTYSRYGLVHQTLNYGMNRHIVGPVSAQIDQYQYFNQHDRNETVGRINLGFNF